MSTILHHIYHISEAQRSTFQAISPSPIGVQRIDYGLTDWTKRMGKNQAFTVPIRGDGKAQELSACMVP